MNTVLTFYFRPLPRPLTLSREYGVILRNALPEELPRLEAGIRDIFGVLSDKEKRRILYTLYPLGAPSAHGSLDEIFTRTLARLWVLMENLSTLPFPPSYYGALCGMYSAGSYLQSPSSFTAAAPNAGRRFFLRSLKNELPAAASLIEIPREDGLLQPLLHFCCSLDSILAQKNRHFWLNTVAEALSRTAETRESALLQQTYAAKLLLGLPIEDKGYLFSRKMALIRYLALKIKGENALEAPSSMEKRLGQCDPRRSGDYLFHTLRLALFLMTEDPQLFFYLKDSETLWADENP